MTVNEKMRVRLRIVRQPAPECEQFSNVFSPGRNHASVALVDDVVEAKLEPCVLAKGAKCPGTGHSGSRIERT